MSTVRSRGRTYGRDPSEPKPRNDAYVGLLILSLVAQVAGATFLLIDWYRYPSGGPQKPSALAAAPAAPTAANPAPAGNPPAGNPPAVNPPAGNPMPPAGNPMPPKMP